MSYFYFIFLIFKYIDTDILFQMFFILHIIWIKKKKKTKGEREVSMRSTSRWKSFFIK